MVFWFGVRFALSVLDAQYTYSNPLTHFAVFSVAVFSNTLGHTQLLSISSVLELVEGGGVRWKGGEQQTGRLWPQMEMDCEWFDCIRAQY